MKHFFKLCLLATSLVSITAVAASSTNTTIKTFCSQQTSTSTCFTNCTKKFSTNSSFRASATQGCLSYVHDHFPAGQGISNGCVKASFACAGTGTTSDDAGGLCRLPSCRQYFKGN